MWEEWKELKKPLAVLFVLWICLSLIYFSLPSPKNSVSSIFFKKIQNDLLPKDIKLISVNPAEVVMISLEISLALGFVTIFPFLIIVIMRFFNPALYSHEKKFILKIFFITVPLFFAGVFFAYFLFLPLIYKFLFFFFQAYNVVPFIGIGEFVSSILIITIVIGILFLLPLFMRVLTKLKVANKKTWKKNLGTFILFFAIVGAIITPDGTGITQLIFIGVFALLYIIGILISGG